jgi:Spy/CpxP family protein refolding chaperone
MFLRIQQKDYPMKNKLSVLLASAVLVVSLTSASAVAMNNGVNHDQKHRKDAAGKIEKFERFQQHKFKKMARFLNLTDEQRQQAKAIHRQAKESRLVLKESLQGFHQQSKILMMEEHFNEQAFLNLKSQYQESFAQMALIKVKTKHSFMQLLTAEQKEKMQTHKGFGKRRARHSK